MTTIKERGEAWPKEPDAEPYDSYHLRRVVFLEARLRDTAAALKERQDTIDWIFACFPALTEVLTPEQIESTGRGGSDARDALAQLEKEGFK